MTARGRVPGAGLRALGAAVVVACIVPVQANAQTESARAPARSAEPECVSLPDAIERDGADWVKPARMLQASAQPDPAVAIGLRERAALTLAADATVSLLVQPRGGPAQAGGYGGFVAFRSGPGGPYRVSLEERAWIEIIGQASAHPAVVTLSDKRMHCFGVGKNLVFELAADTPYFIQLSAAARPAMGLLVSPP
jgi:hypothetical protein